MDTIPHRVPTIDKSDQYHLNAIVQSLSIYNLFTPGLFEAASLLSSLQPYLKTGQVQTKHKLSSRND